MPGKNIVKQYAPESYYHIYNRGVNKRKIFMDAEDYTVFLNLLKRYLSREAGKDSYGRTHETYYNQIELLAFCLMQNHFHLLIYVGENERAMPELIKKIATSYVVYFNKKHKRVGALFQDSYKASRISSDNYLQHISRYIHLNPKEYLSWEFSSMPYYLKSKNAEWLRPEKILEIFEGESYLDFVNDYKDHKEVLDSIKHELADK